MEQYNYDPTQDEATYLYDLTTGEVVSTTLADIEAWSGTNEQPTENPASDESAPADQ